MIKQSDGPERVFQSGAVRDANENKGRMDLLAWNALLRGSRHYQHGAVRYKPHNWEAGIPVSAFLDSCLRHIAKYLCGCDDEDHLAAALFNISGAMEMEQTHPELIDIPNRQGKKRFCYFDESQDMKSAILDFAEEEYNEPSTAPSGRKRNTP